MADTIEELAEDMSVVYENVDTLYNIREVMAKKFMSFDSLVEIGLGNLYGKFVSCVSKDTKKTNVHLVMKNGKFEIPFSERFDDIDERALKNANTSVYLFNRYYGHNQ